jgi:hypothetical protein
MLAGVSGEITLARGFRCVPAMIIALNRARAYLILQTSCPILHGWTAEDQAVASPR